MKVRKLNEYYDIQRKPKEKKSFPNKIILFEDYQEYEILYETEEEYQGKSLAVVEYDPSSNKPFMVYKLNMETMEYEPYSGEDELDFAVGVADDLIKEYI